MKHILCSTMKNYKKEYLPKDIFSGIIMAAVSIPISMGYAQIAGLPAVYGLYGSVFPILFFALFSTSRQSMRHRRQLSEQHWYHLGLKAEVKRQCSMCL